MPVSGGLIVNAKPKEAVFMVVVTRCGCGNPASHLGPGEVCPRPRAIEDRGVVAYYHRNPIRRALWALAHPKKVAA